MLPTLKADAAFYGKHSATVRHPRTGSSFHGWLQLHTDCFWFCFQLSGVRQYAHLPAASKSEHSITVCYSSMATLPWVPQLHALMHRADHLPRSPWKPKISEPAFVITPYPLWKLQASPADSSCSTEHEPSIRILDICLTRLLNAGFLISASIQLVPDLWSQRVTSCWLTYCNSMKNKIKIHYLCADV